MPVMWACGSSSNVGFCISTMHSIIIGKPVTPHELLFVSLTSKSKCNYCKPTPPAARSFWVGS